MKLYQKVFNILRFTFFAKHKKIGDTFSWTSSVVELRETDKYGKGVFAKQKIKKGDLISIFGGYVIPTIETQFLPKKINDNYINISEDFSLGVKSVSETEIACFFNHSCDPNAGINGQILLVAMRNIEKNEEVTFDYATSMHKVKTMNNYKLHCLCGTRKCRKLVTGNDWKKIEIQEKYRGYFQYYLEKKINKIKHK